MLNLNDPRQKHEVNRKLLECPRLAEKGVLLTALNAPGIAEAILRHVVESRVSLKPVSLAVEVSQKVGGILDKLRGKVKQPTPHRPQRLDSPVDDGTFQANIETGEASPYKEAIHYVIGCSRYEKGSVNRLLRKLTISDRLTNMTMEALTPDNIDGCEFNVRRVDDQFEEIPFDDILKDAEDSAKKVVVSLAGVQTNQYPRALAIAAKLRAAAIRRGLDGKIDILFGGFHIRADEESRKEVQEHGFTAVDGEAEEGRLGSILTDCVHDRVKPLYEWKDENGKDRRVSIKGSPIIKPLREHIDRYNPYQALPIQFSRGCPWGCEFCAVTGVDGAKIRGRNPEEVKVLLEHMGREGINKFVITDDNFYRHPHKNEILDMLIALKGQGIEFGITIQTDLKVMKKVDGEEVVDTEFMDKCQEAGIKLAFCGTESFDPDVLRELGKNHQIKETPEATEEHMRKQREAWNKRGITLLYPFMIGNEKDKPGMGKRVAEAALRIGANVVIPITRMILPGSKDAAKINDGTITHIDPDLSKYVGHDPVITWADESSLTPEQVMQEYWDVVTTFYRPENIPQTCYDVDSLRHFCWMMIVTRSRQENVMDNGTWRPILFKERFKPNEHRKDMTLCKLTA